MRYKPTIKWNKKSIVYNLFRIYELLFGREYGIRPEAETESTRLDNGQTIINHKFYTWEAFLVHVEQRVFITIKNFFKGLPRIRVEVKELAMPNLGGYKPASPHIMLAVAFDAVTGQDDDTGTSHTTAHTVTGSDVGLTVGVLGAQTGEGDWLTALTYNSVSMTIAQGHNDASYRWAYLYYLTAPSTGANDVVSSWSSSTFSRHCITSFSGTNQSDLLDSSAKDFSAASADETISTTVVASDCWLVAWFVTSSGGSTLTAGTGTTLRGTASETQIADSNGTVSTGSQGLQATITSGKWNNCIVSIAPAGAAAVGGSNMSLLGVS